MAFNKKKLIKTQNSHSFMCFQPDSRNRSEDVDKEKIINRNFKDFHFPFLFGINSGDPL